MPSRNSSRKVSDVAKRSPKAIGRTVSKGVSADDSLITRPLVRRRPQRGDPARSFDVPNRDGPVRIRDDPRNGRARTVPPCTVRAVARERPGKKSRAWRGSAKLTGRRQKE
ncbi:hypothetical protein GCM10007904_16000 [Oharaeibacter diazotrophicus]|nr:hypothetical protein GCM10007904_16000 [Oharaeibacter diazotrophicus]